jgi:hypothetical protein
LRALHVHDMFKLSPAQPGRRRAWNRQRRRQGRSGEEPAPAASPPALSACRPETGFRRWPGDAFARRVDFPCWAARGLPFLSMCPCPRRGRGEGGRKPCCKSLISLDPEKEMQGNANVPALFSMQEASPNLPFRGPENVGRRLLPQSRRTSLARSRCPEGAAIAFARKKGFDGGGFPARGRRPRKGAWSRRKG